MISRFLVAQQGREFMHVRVHIIVLTIKGIGNAVQTRLCSCGMQIYNDVWRLFMRARYIHENLIGNLKISRTSVDIDWSENKLWCIIKIPKYDWFDPEITMLNLVNFRIPFFTNHVYFVPDVRPPLLKGHHLGRHIYIFIYIWWRDC